ncbi:MAG TPA: DUF1223 domain-containing protein [Candidatus Kapabacteria bacterium]|nr:DUF1223 domain-containing protein [Candidatus Kapabacteria bacterium]
MADVQIVRMIAWLLLLPAVSVLHACREPLRMRIAGRSEAAHVRTGSSRRIDVGVDTMHAGIVVAELFTSEGCSSCPAADALFNTYVGTTVANRDHLYLLAFHVDYWNRLGWRDRFSDSAYSERQQWYARILGMDGIYTPELVVNGTAECVGSDANSVRALLRGATQSSSVPLIADARASISLRHDAVEVRYHVHPWSMQAGAPRDLVINCALIERGLRSNVASGENEGRRLVHENVVRAFAHTPLEARTRVDSLLQRLALPNDLMPEHASVILYAQQLSTGRILNAVEVAIADTDQTH